MELSPSTLKGGSVYVNPPFRKIEQFARKLIDLRDTSSTESVLVTPWDPRRKWFSYVSSNFELVALVKGNFVCPDGHKLFSRPARRHTTRREEPGTSPFDAAIWFSKDRPDDEIPDFHNLPYIGSTFEERAKTPTKLMTFRCRLQGQNVTALIDNGAEVNLVSNKLQKYLGLETSESPTNLAWFDGSTTTASSMVPSLDFTLNGHACSASNLLCAKLATFDLVLGAPWLEANEVKLDYSSKPHRMFIRGHKLTPCDHVPRGVTNTTPQQLLGFISYTKAVKVLKKENLPLLLY